MKYFKIIKNNFNKINMSFIYSIIARSKKIILTEYTEYTGNFPQISLTILNKAKSNKKCSVSYHE